MIFTRLVNYSYSKLYRFFFRKCYKSYGKNVRMIFPMQIQGAKRIIIGDNARIGYKTWLASMPINNNDHSILIIGEGSYIGNFNHIYCTKEICIGRKVLIADKVYISDNLHSFANPNIPIMEQPIKQLNIVKIGDGAWIGENACIIGASVGKNSVIGANSVVTKDIPDYCVAVGAPARVIKKYDIEKQTWDNV